MQLDDGLGFALRGAEVIDEPPRQSLAPGGPLGLGPDDDALRSDFAVVGLPERVGNERAQFVLARMRRPARPKYLGEIGLDDVAFEPAFLVAGLQIEVQGFRAFVTRLEDRAQGRACATPAHGFLRPQRRQNCVAFFIVKRPRVAAGDGEIVDLLQHAALLAKPGAFRAQRLAPA